MSAIKNSEVVLDRCLSLLISRTAPDYIVEIGCFDGSALAAFGKNSPYSKRVGFEANPSNFFNLCLGKDIQYMAVSNQTGTIKFYEQLPDPKVRSSPGRMLKKTGSTFKILGVDKYIEYTVPCTTLDDFFRIEIENGKTFVLIVDAEGSTKEILEGGKDFLKNTIALKIEVETEEYFEGQSLENSCLSILRDMVLIGNQVSSEKRKVIQKNYYFISDIKYSSAFGAY